MRLSLSQITELARGHGFADPALAAAVAMAESGGVTDAVHDTTGQTSFPPGILPENSVGLWQVNTINSGGDNQPNRYAAWDLSDPDVNAQAAYEISNGGTQWIPGWTSTVRSGLYRPYYAGPHTLDANGVLRSVLRPPAARPSLVWPLAGTAVLVAVAGLTARARRRFA